MAGFKTGFVVGAIVVAFGTGWLIDRLESQPIMFSPLYVGVQPDYVRVVGSVVGNEKVEKDRPANNGLLLTCWRPDRTCKYLHIEEIGRNQVGEIDDQLLTVRKWDEEELVTDNLDEALRVGSCNYYEFRLLLKSKDVTYTRLPNAKADRARCKQLFGNSAPLRQWRVADGPGWGEYEKGE